MAHLVAAKNALVTQIGTTWADVKATGHGIFLSNQLMQLDFQARITGGALPIAVLDYRQEGAYEYGGDPGRDTGPIWIYRVVKDSETMDQLIGKVEALRDVFWAARQTVNAYGVVQEYPTVAFHMDQPLQRWFWEAQLPLLCASVRLEVECAELGRMIAVTLRAPGLAKLKARFRQAPPVVARELRLGLEWSLERQADETRKRTPVRSGALRDSIAWKIDGQGVRLRGSVFSPLAYAAPVEYGTKPRIIRARHARFLRFVIGGRVIFARQVRHPGHKGVFMFRDGAKASVVPTRRFLAARLGNVTRFLGYR